jgi:hypothetical protein
MTLLRGNSRNQVKRNECSFSCYTRVGVGWDLLGPLLPQVAYPGLLVPQVQVAPCPLVCGNELQSPFLPGRLRSSLPSPPVFLAELFLGLSLTSTANQACSDKALKSSACVSHSGWVWPSWTQAESRAEVGVHVAGGRAGRPQPAAVVGGECLGQAAQRLHLQEGVRQWQTVHTSCLDSASLRACGGCFLTATIKG